MSSVQEKLDSIMVAADHHADMVKQAIDTLVDLHRCRCVWNEAAALCAQLINIQTKLRQATRMMQQDDPAKLLVQEAVEAITVINSRCYSCGYLDGDHDEFCKEGV